MTDHIEDSPIKKKNREGQPPNSIWKDINKGEAVGSGKFAASCKYCKNTWSRGEVSKLEEHLSNYCPDAPAAVVRKYMTKVMERQDKSKSSKKRKYSEGQIKFFIACGIAFRIVKHLFFINFIKELNVGYNTPTREVLVNQLLERELAQVNFKVNSELEKETNLTLVFDGWTSGTHRSIWNFIVMTPSHKEYLYQLSDLSENSHTAEYLVTDLHSHQANAKLAQIIKEKGISGGGLKLYCKTHWTTASESVNSVINLESALKEMANPLRKAVLLLESRRATLADCFLSMARFAATLKNLPKSLNPAFRSHCIKI
ncbi:ribonuclease H-like domain-containing protein [Rhizophagus irregularis DAOM 181602=DAOM 197198]|nr:ribonuclease H-like domain-containing protein [Rhizophagus irregularis DAOM 181602=DAOM 197198]